MSNVRYETEFGIVHLPPSKDAKIDWDAIRDQEDFNKRIGIKILQKRAAPREKFSVDQFKAQALRDIAENKSVKNFCDSNMISLMNSQASIQKQTITKVISADNRPIKPTPSHREQNALL